MAPPFQRLPQEVLTRPEPVAVTHFFLVDADMDIRPSAFDLVTLLRLGEATNVSILSPAPYGGGNGFYQYQGGQMRNGLVAVTWELEDTHCNGGGFCCIPGSERAPSPRRSRALSA